MTWLGRLLRGRRLESDLDRELRDHIERQVAAYLSDGLTESEARRRARLEFGGLDQTKELCRDARGTRMVQDFVQDIRYATRVLAKDRGFAAVAIGTLALGSAPTWPSSVSSMPSVLRPLPVRNPQELIGLIRMMNENRPSTSHPAGRPPGRADRNVFGARRIWE